MNDMSHRERVICRGQLTLMSNYQRKYAGERLQHTILAQAFLLKRHIVQGVARVCYASLYASCHYETNRSRPISFATQ